MKLIEDINKQCGPDELKLLKLFYEAHQNDLENLKKNIMPNLSDPYEKELLSNLIANDGHFVELYHQGLTLKEVAIYVAIFLLLSIGRGLTL